MSIASEITRLQNAKEDIKTAIEAKGVTIPSNATLDEFDSYIEDIPTGTTPTGTISITENGTHDVTNYASASVNVSGGGQTLTIESGSTSKPGFQKVIENLPSLDISGTSCNYMFYNYTGSTIPVLNGTSNVTKMENMFQNCIYVTNFNLDNWNTSNVTSMKNMFSCSSAIAIRNLDCSSFNVENVTNMAGMFNGLYQLAILDISSFDFSGVINYGSMFTSCGTYSKQADGAYADGIPYVYVKNATAQNWVLTENNGHPNTWSTNNVVIKNS